MAAQKPKVIELALQGGGAHGAFTWGVLDRLLEDGRLRIEGLSGTSAGAMNGAVVADGIVNGGYEVAREGLERFWSAVSSAAQFSPLKRSPIDMLLGRWSLDYTPGYLMAEAMSRVFTPYDFNPLDINPLRSLGFLWELIHYEDLDRERYRDARIHRIHAEAEMLEFSVSSKFNAEWAFLTHLRDLGRDAAGNWLEKHYDDIGSRSTFDVSFIFEESLSPAHLPEDAVRSPKSKS